jgi:glycosyltransferase involved in cell wall biosynthesis
MSSGIRDPAVGSDDMTSRRPHLDVVTGDGPRDETRTLTSLMRAARVSVIVPTLNEAANLPYVLDRMPEGVYEVIVVDGRSTDDTIAVARECRPDALIVEQTGRGKGNALACGFWEATGDILVMLDADGSTDPAEIPRFVAALLGGADFAKGSRFVTGGATDDITLTRRWGNRCLSIAVNLLWKVAYTDLCYGYNAFWRRCLPFVAPDCNGFEVETLMNIRAARAGFVVHEVPSHERQRRHGTSNLRAFRDGTRVLRTIAAERIRPG